MRWSLYVEACSRTSDALPREGLRATGRTPLTVILPNIKMNFCFGQYRFREIVSISLEL